MNKDKVVQIEVDGEEYTLVASRKLLLRLKSICPNLLKIAENKVKLSKEEEEELEYKTFDQLYDNADKLFYTMISSAHQDMTKKQSDEIYEKFCEEYQNAEFKIIELAMMVFPQGNPTQKKKIANW